MNRRSFLSAILAAGAAPAIVRASSLMPWRATEAIPWQPTDAGVLVRRGGMTLLTPTMITREALAILERELRFSPRLAFPRP